MEAFRRKSTDYRYCRKCLNGSNNSLRVRTQRIPRLMCSSSTTTHEKRLRMLDPPELNLTYPPGNEVLNPRHFYQTQITNWLDKPPHPVSLKQMTAFGKHLTEQKLILSANLVAEELTVRFAHRLRQMQNLPYRLMSNAHLSQTYETYVNSFDMLRKAPLTSDLNGNKRLCSMGQELLTRHTRVIPDIIGGMLDLMRAGLSSEDTDLLNGLVKKLLTSRLSRRVMVKQHLRLTESLSQFGGRHRNNYIGEIYMKCTIDETVRYAEKKARETLAPLFPGVVDFPKIEIEGDSNVPFPYIRAHLDYIIGEVLRNSMEACAKVGNRTDPIIISVSSSDENVFVRISDRGGGISPAKKLNNLWSFAKPLDEYPTVVDNFRLSEHGFYNLIFPSEDLPDSVQADIRRSRDPDIHFGLGLALARLYIEYWGGTLDIHSLEGFGCDAILRFSRFGDVQENLRFTS